MATGIIGYSVLLFWGLLTIVGSLNRAPPWEGPDVVAFFTISFLIAGAVGSAGGLRLSRGRHPDSEHTLDQPDA